MANPPIKTTSRRELRRRLHKENRRVQIGRAAVVGVLSGLAAVAFQLGVARAESFARWLASSAAPVLVVVATATMGCLAAGITARYAPEAGGSGIPHIKAVLLHIRTIRPVRLILVKVSAGLLALASGMSLGREGPTVQI